MERRNEDDRSLFRRLIASDAKESSKRVLAMYVVVIIGTIITLVSIFNGVNYIVLLATWLGFAAALLGLSEYNKNRKVKHDADIKIAELEKEKVEKKISG